MATLADVSLTVLMDEVPLVLESCSPEHDREMDEPFAVVTFGRIDVNSLIQALYVVECADNA